MVKLTNKQKKVMLLLDDANVNPAPVSMDVVQELVKLGLIGKSGTAHMELTDEGEKAIKELHATKD